MKEAHLIAIYKQQFVVLLVTSNTIESISFWYEAY